MHTAFPAAASTWAAVAPPGPEPTTTTSKSKSGTRHLFIGPPAGLDVAGVPDRAPRREVTVAAVFGRPVTRLTRVFEQQVGELGQRRERRFLLGRVEVEEARVQRSDAVAVDLLPAAH